MHSNRKPAGMSSTLNNKEVPCAVCHRKQGSSVLMIPGKFLRKPHLVYICTFSPMVTSGCLLSEKPLLCIEALFPSSLLVIV